MSIDIFSLLQTYPHNPHYLKRYYNFILSCIKVNSSKSKEELGYTEKHHILPQTLFDEYKNLKLYPENSSVLTYKQHIIAHHILIKVYKDNKKLLYALYLMTKSLSITKNDLSILKIIRNLDIKRTNHPNYGKPRSAETKKKLSEINLGKRATYETRLKHSIARSGNKNNMYGKRHSEETLLKMSKCKLGENNPRYNVKTSEFTKLKQSLAQMGRKHEIIACPHCDKTGIKPNMIRWHFDNCKHKIIPS